MSVDLRIKTFSHNRDRWVNDGLYNEVYINDAGEYAFDPVFKDDFDYSTFMLRSPQNDKDYIAHFSCANFDLLSEVFLDTDDPCFCYYTNVILLNRGLSSFHIHMYRIILSTGLWWNIFWWEWVSFDIKDFYLGWKLNFSFLTLPYILCVFFAYAFFKSIILSLFTAFVFPLLLFGWATLMYLSSDLPKSVTYATGHSTLNQ